MSRRLAFCILSFFAILLPIRPQEKQVGHFTIHGRVIDKDGYPIKGARVELDDLPSDDLHFTYQSDDSGHFRFEEQTVRAERQAILYVTGPRVEKRMELISPPYNRYEHSPGFEGKPILLKIDDDIDVGDVPVQVNYGSVHVFLSNPSGEPFGMSAEAWHHSAFRVRDTNGLMIVELGLSIKDIEDDVDISNSAVNLTLPEGKWYLDFVTIFAQWNKERDWSKSASPVVVKTDQPAEVILKVAR